MVCPLGKGTPPQVYPPPIFLKSDMMFVGIAWSSFVFIQKQSYFFKSDRIVDGMLLFFGGGGLGEGTFKKGSVSEKVSIK